MLKLDKLANKSKEYSQLSKVRTLRDQTRLKQNSKYVNRITACTKPHS